VHLFRRRNRSKQAKIVAWTFSVCIHLVKKRRKDFDKSFIFWLMDLFLNKQGKDWMDLINIQTLCFIWNDSRSFSKTVNYHLNKISYRSNETSILFVERNESSRRNFRSCILLERQSTKTIQIDAIILNRINRSLHVPFSSLWPITISSAIDLCLKLWTNIPLTAFLILYCTLINLF
jgi:hypothetical protein